MKVRVEEQHGDPARVIVLHANARKVDLVVDGAQTGEGAGGGSERVRSPNASSGVRHGRSLIVPGMLGELACSTRRLHGRVRSVRGSLGRCPIKQAPEKHRGRRNTCGDRSRTGSPN